MVIMHIIILSSLEIINYFLFYFIDYFINELIKIRSERGLKTPVLIGLSLEEQIIDQIPIDSHDR